MKRIMRTKVFPTEWKKSIAWFPVEFTSEDKYYRIWLETYSWREISSYTYEIQCKGVTGTYYDGSKGYD